MATKKKTGPRIRPIVEPEAAAPAQAYAVSDPPGSRLRLALVFVAVLAAHFAWKTYLQPTRCAAPAAAEGSAAEANEGDQCSPLEMYLEAGNEWLGLSYALGLTFAFYAWTRFRRDRSQKAENATLGGLGIAGLVPVVGCFLIGCCGSPMLGVWLGLLGPHFLPFARPLVLVLTAASVAWGCRILNRKGACDACDAINETLER